MEDLLTGLEDWRQIQDVVRSTFKSLHEVMRAQGMRIKQLEQKLGSCVSGREIETLQVSMSNKPTFAELSKEIEDRMSELGLRSLKRQMASKVDKSELKEMYEDFTAATARIGDGSSALEALVQQQQEEIVRLKRDVKLLMDSKGQDDDLISKFATRKWVQELLDLEDQSRKEAQSRAHVELAGQIKSLEKKLEQFPTVSNIDLVLARKVDMETLTRALEDRPTNGEVKKQILNRTNEAIVTVQEQTRSILKDAVELSMTRMKSEIDRLEDELQEKISRGELLEVYSDKVTADELEEKLSETFSIVTSDFKEIVKAIQRELVQVINKKAFKAEVNKRIEDKVNKDELRSMLTSKAEVVDMRDALVRKADDVKLEELALKFEKMKAIVIPASRAAEPGEKLKDDAGQIQELIKRIETLQEEKAGAKDVCVLLDQKPSVEDVNEALAKITDQLNSTHLKQRSEEMPAIEQLRKDVDSIADAINAELCLGRWIWSSGRVLNDRSIPWNTESINTATDNILWEKDSSEIATVLPGLYEISLGFFTESDPSVKILVNGEPILYTIQRRNTSNPKQTNGTGAITTTAVVRKNKPGENGPLLRRAKHSAGNVTGWTLLDFIALPSRARLTVLFEGDSSAQGFLGLRKL